MAMRSGEDLGRSDRKLIAQCEFDVASFVAKQPPVLAAMLVATNCASRTRAMYANNSCEIRQALSSASPSLARSRINGF